MVGFALPSLLHKPAWLQALLSEKFFSACADHAASKKNERNIYCVDCSFGICQHCLASHGSHRLLQVRRYVYHDVIRLQDLQKLVDCALVQTYIINSAKVVFLNQRPQPRPSKGLGNSCETCDRSLQDAYRYCSVACKVDAVVKQGKDLQPLLPQCSSLHLEENRSPSESLKLCETEAEEQLSPNSVLEGRNSPASSGSTANDSLLWGTNLSSTATTVPPFERNRSSHTSRPLKSKILPSFNRRKRTPHRSPFC